MTNSHKKRLLYWFGLALLSLMPIAFYFWIFGGSFSKSQGDWGNFGSFLGGIYSPVIGFLTLVILVRQGRLQKNFSDFQEHETLMSNVRHDTEYLLDKLEKLISVIVSHNSNRTTINKQDYSKWEYLLISDHHIADQDEDCLVKLAENYPHLLPMWFSILALLNKVEKAKFDQSNKDYQFLKAKCIAVLSFNTCRALDRVLEKNWGGIAKKYHFWNKENLVKSSINDYTDE
jgi:hypothetical protein